MSGAWTRFARLVWTATPEARASGQFRLVPSCTEGVGLDGPGPSIVIGLEPS